MGRENKSYQDLQEIYKAFEDQLAGIASASTPSAGRSATATAPMLAWTELRCPLPGTTENRIGRGEPVHVLERDVPAAADGCPEAGASEGGPLRLPGCSAASGDC